MATTSNSAVDGAGAPVENAPAATPGTSTAGGIDPNANNNDTTNNVGEPSSSAAAPPPPPAATAVPETSVMTKTTVCLPIVYGSIAFYLGKKADEFSTHRWTLYIRGPNHEDLSVVISKVIFQLHASFAKPIRELSTPPFEVTECGWGEFEAQIRIIWKDPEEKPTMVSHGIKLYPPGAVPNVLPTEASTSEPVLAESYDEVVFTDPEESFYRQLMRIKNVPKVEMSQGLEEHLTKHQKVYTDADEFATLVEAQKFLTAELSSVKERFQLVTEELQQVEADLAVAQQESKKSSSGGGAKSGGGTTRKQRPASAAGGSAASGGSSKKAKTAPPST